MKRLTQAESGLTAQEYVTLTRLTTPAQIQDFLDMLAFNFEKEGNTHRSPQRVLAVKRAHCIEGALLAAAALWIAGEPPIIMNLSPKLGKGDFDHVVALFRRDGLWGAISKTNHSVLRFRDPVYRTPRELALSYFHEWFLPQTGEKVLECYSKPLDMRRFGTSWIADEKDGWHISDALAERKHYALVPRGSWRFVRAADTMEQRSASVAEWDKGDVRT